MNLSAILVVATPTKLQAVRKQLELLNGVDTHHSDPASGRLIATIEAPDLKQEIDMLKCIKALPDVAMAEMVEHHFEEELENYSALLEGLPEGLPEVPRFLNEDSPSPVVGREGE